MYLLMCGTRSDDLILCGFTTQEKAAEHAELLLADRERLAGVVEVALDKLARDCSDPLLMYLLHIDSSGAVVMCDVMWDID